MLKKSLQTSKLSLIIGLCLYGGAYQPEMMAAHATSTNIDLPNASGLDSPEIQFTVISRTNDPKTRMRRWEGELFVKMYQNEQTWFLRADLETKWEPEDKDTNPPTFDKKSVQVFPEYSGLVAKKIDHDSEHSWALSAIMPIAIHDPNWHLTWDERVVPTVTTYLSNETYPREDTTVTINGKYGFEVHDESTQTSKN